MGVMRSRSGAEEMEVVVRCSERAAMASLCAAAAGQSD